MRYLEDLEVNTSTTCVVSVNVGRPRAVKHDGESIATAIYKEPVDSRVAIRRLNLDGDQQADLTVHGGPDRAVYIYPAEHYRFWQQLYPDVELGPAQFGENLTTRGLLEDSVCIGDEYRVGTALVRVTQPRIPCFKLGMRFGHSHMIVRFLQSGKTGFHCSVVEEGDVGMGDDIELVDRSSYSLSVAMVTELYCGHHADPALLKRAVQLPCLAKPVQDYLLRKLTRASAST